MGLGMESVQFGEEGGGCHGFEAAAAAATQTLNIWNE